MTRACKPNDRQVGYHIDMFEHREEPLLSRREFARRMLGCIGLASSIAAGSLAGGSIGYHIFGELAWIDSFLNASMILTGMGPVDPMRTASGKLFAAFYALYSGIAFLSMMAVITAPVAHRILHQFHLASDDDN
jgi:hypothetical protein